MEISCDSCVMQHTNACEDCVVRFIVDRHPGEAIVIDVEEERAVRMLADAGLVPELRHRRAQATGYAGASARSAAVFDCALGRWANGS